MKLNISPEHIAVSTGKVRFSILLTDAWSQFVEKVAICSTDKEERLDHALFIVSGFFDDLERCFPGSSFVGFADAPNDNSISEVRARSAKDQAAARRESAAFRALQAAGVSERTMQALAARAVRQCRDGTLAVTFAPAESHQPNPKPENTSHRLGTAPTGQRAYALVIPAEFSAMQAGETFGFALKLADVALEMQGWRKPDPDDINNVAGRRRIRTREKIAETVQTLLDPRRSRREPHLVEAQHRIVRAAAWTLDLEALLPYYGGTVTDNELKIREWIEHRVREPGIQHLWLDELVEYDRDLSAPGLLAQIHKQIDEDGGGL